MSGMAFRPPAERKTVHLSVTPLIDVLFLLIIFFTLTSTFKRAGEMELQLPESTTADPQPGDRPHEVDLVAMEDGRILVDGAPVGDGDLGERLAAARRDDPEGRVSLRAEAGVPHGEVVHLLDAVRTAGFPGVGIATYTAPPE